MKRKRYFLWALAGILAVALGSGLVALPGDGRAAAGLLLALGVLCSFHAGALAQRDGMW